MDCYSSFVSIARLIDVSDEVAKLRNTPWKRSFPLPGRWGLSDPEIRKLVTNNLRNCPVAMTYIGSHVTVNYDGNEVLYELREV